MYADSQNMAFLKILSKVTSSWMWAAFMWPPVPSSILFPWLHPVCKPCHVPLEAWPVWGTERDLVTSLGTASYFCKHITYNSESESEQCLETRHLKCFFQPLCVSHEGVHIFDVFTCNTSSKDTILNLPNNKSVHDSSQLNCDSLSLSPWQQCSVIGGFIYLDREWNV